LASPRNKVYFFNQALNNGFVKIGYLPLDNDAQPLLNIDLADAVDEDLVSFTAETFRVFCDTYLGFDNASDAGAQAKDYFIEVAMGRVEDTSSVNKFGYNLDVDSEQKRLSPHLAEH
jgi:hypothetical protein